MKGEFAGIYKLRVGDYRVLYEVSEERREIVVLMIDHRGEIYRH